MTSFKVRIYDLAKELKMESKRIMEEVRREGVDVSVPSNTISKELAEKIRNKYFPKKEPTVHRTVRVVKKAKAAEAGEAPHDEESVTADEAAPHVDEVYAAPEHDASTVSAAEPHPELPPEGTTQGGAVRALRFRKLPTAARAERPESTPSQADRVRRKPRTMTQRQRLRESDAPSPILYSTQTVISRRSSRRRRGRRAGGAGFSRSQSPAAAIPGGGRVLRPTSAALARALRRASA